MPRSSVSCLLADLSWVEVREHLDHDSRLIVPVGAFDQYGPHLPLGATTLIAEAIADQIGREFDVLRAPALRYGVNFPSERPYAGTSTLREKTLHAVLNDLLACWEDDGFTEFILITAHTRAPHVEAIATVSSTRARIRVIEVLGIDFSDILDGEPGPQHGGEIVTSLMLHLYPDMVHMERAQDYFPSRRPHGPPPYSVDCIPSSSPGSIGQPTLATAEKGERIFSLITRKIREKVFLSETDGSD